jgi:hypothetical protein
VGATVGYYPNKNPSLNGSLGSLPDLSINPELSIYLKRKIIKKWSLGLSLSHYTNNKDLIFSNYDKAKIVNRNISVHLIVDYKLLEIKKHSIILTAGVQHNTQWNYINSLDKTISNNNNSNKTTIIQSVYLASSYNYELFKAVVATAQFRLHYDPNATFTSISIPTNVYLTIIPAFNIGLAYKF